MIEAVIRDDPEVLVLWREAMKLESGTRTDLGNNITEVQAFTGTGRAYTLDRLKREAPALYQRVVAKELSANKAAIQAGFHKVPATIEVARKASGSAFQGQQSIGLPCPDAACAILRLPNRAMLDERGRFGDIAGVTAAFVVAGRSNPKITEFSLCQ